MRRGNVTKDEIVEDIRTKILDEKLEQGQSLVEREMCATYRVSRTPMREILWKLVSDGVVEHRPSYGFSVRKLNWEQIFEIFETREAIEGMAARLACQRSESGLIDQLKSLKAELEEIDIDRDPKTGGSIGRKMHKLIIDGASNKLLGDFYKKIEYLAKLTTNISTRSPGIETESKKYHLAVMQAIIDGDAEKSELYMREHLRLTCRKIIEKFYPQVFSTRSSVEAE